MVASEYDDELPRGYSELTALPGVGDYTASAVMSFAYGERIAVVDTNIRRVLSRVFLGEESLGGSASPLERALADCVLPAGARDATTWNQAVMELGALVCTAKQPQCEVCPVRTQCRFFAAGLPNLGSGARARANGSPARTGRCAGVCCMRCANWSPRRRRARVCARGGAVAGPCAARPVHRFARRGRADRDPAGTRAAAAAIAAA